MKEKSKTIYLPIYDVWFEVVVSTNPLKSRNSKARKKRLGPYKPEVGFAALSSWKGSNLAVFFGMKEVTHGHISHEVFHTTHNIIQLIGEDFTNDHSEPAAYLNGFLAQEVYKALKSWKIKPK